MMNTDQADLQTTVARLEAESALFHSLDEALNKDVALSSILSLALSGAKALTGADSGTIGQVTKDPQSDLPRLELLVGTGDEADEPLLVPDSQPVFNQLLTTKTAFQLSPAPPFQGTAAAGAGQLLAIPTLQNDTVSGAITLVRNQELPFTAADEHFGRQLAARLAVILERARLRSVIATANEAKSEFVSVVTHELRLPMTSIKGYADLLGMMGTLSDQQKEFLDIIKRNLQRMSTLISDLSDINRLDSGRLRMEPKAYDIVPIVEEAVKNWDQLIAERQQTLSVTFAPDLPAVYADRNRVIQVLGNLISNAHKYTADEGSITVTVTADTDAVQISIADTGLGIKEEEVAQLFTPFFRSDNEAVRQQTGWGLGLTIVEKIVRSSGGVVTFSSRYGEGSTFCFTLPVATATS